MIFRFEVADRIEYGRIESPLWLAQILYWDFKIILTPFWSDIKKIVLPTVGRFFLSLKDCGSYLARLKLTQKFLKPRLSISKLGHKIFIFSSDSSVQTFVIDTGMTKSTESFS